MADKKSQVKEITNKLKDGIQGIFESDQYANYLKTMIKLFTRKNVPTLIFTVRRRNILTILVLK